jgi:hypothetical protein
LINVFFAKGNVTNYLPTGINTEIMKQKYYNNSVIKYGIHSLFKQIKCGIIIDDNNFLKKKLFTL